MNLFRPECTEQLALIAEAESWEADAFKWLLKEPYGHERKRQIAERMLPCGRVSIVAEGPRATIQIDHGPDSVRLSGVPLESLYGAFQAMRKALWELDREWS